MRAVVRRDSVLPYCPSHLTYVPCCGFGPGWNVSLSCSVLGLL